MKEYVIIVEDNEMQRLVLKTQVEKALDVDVIEMSKGSDLVQYLDSHNDMSHCLCVLLDLMMPGMNGEETLKFVQSEAPHLPVIVITASDDVKQIANVMQQGAADFLPKPVDDLRLQTILQHMHESWGLRTELDSFKQFNTGSMTFERLIGYNGGLKYAVASGMAASKSSVPVLILGESGSGKELFARSIHNFLHEDAPFITVNCGAIPKDLVESTLFGHKKGAFTGAIADHKGKFRQAEGGTLFLDEIGELPMEAQVKLLRVLQEGEVEPVGESKMVKVNTRVIAATHRDMEEAVAEGRFREDLYYRLNVFPIQLPALRERKEDIPALIECFVRKLAQQENREFAGFSAEAVKQLQQYDWPGNVRELENTVYRHLLMAGGALIEQVEIGGMQHVCLFSTPGYTQPTMNSIDLLDAGGRFKTLSEVKEELIECALQHFNHNVLEAAKALDIGKSTLYRYQQQSDA